MTRPAAPPHPDETPIETVAPTSAAPILVLCDHAQNARPSELGDLGLSAADLARHIAYDPGARGVALGIAQRLGAPMLATTYSRLVIDPNRGELDPTVLMRIYDRSIIPGNRYADRAEKARRLRAYHRPYHDAISAQLDTMTAASGRPPLILSVHSFSPALRGQSPRPWQISVLWREDHVTARRLLARLRAEPDLCVGDNEPYRGGLPGDTLDRHARPRGAANALVELRQDLIQTATEQDAWAARLAPMIAALTSAEDGGSARGAPALSASDAAAGA